MDGLELGLAGPGADQLAGTAGSVLAADPGVIFDAPGPVRAVVAFALVLLLGGGLLWRYEAFVDRSIDATMSRPLSSIGYGVAAHLVIAFGAFYLTSQFAKLDVAGVNAGGIGVLVGALLVLLAAALGFTVVGATVGGLWGAGSNWPGLALGALMAGGAAVLDPLLAGVVWIAIVSAGIGGPVRKWLHASALSDV